MKKNIKKNTANLNSYLYPLYFLLTVIPLVVAEYNFTTPLSEYPWYPDGEQMDLFLYGKSILIVLTGITMTLFLFFKGIRDRKKGKANSDFRTFLAFLPLIVYEVMAILSALLSSYPYYTVHGTMDQFEPIWVLLCYGVITYYAYQLIQEERQLNKVLISFLAGTCGVVFIGISQFMKLDFYKFLFRDRNYGFVFEEGRVYATFYNPNYVGSYAALVIPIVFMLAIHSNRKWLKAFYGVLCLLLCAMLLGSRSATGFFISAFIFLLSLFFNRRKLGDYKKFVLPALVILLVLCFLGRDYLKTNYIDKLVYAVKGSSQKESIVLEAITTNQEDIRITYKGHILYLTFSVVDEEAGEYSFGIFDKNQEGVLQEVNNEDGIITLTDKRFEGIRLYPVIAESLGGISAFAVEIEGKTWYFTNQTDGSYYYITALGKLDKIESHAALLFDEHGGFASGRGYIWSKTLPLLADTVLVGTGPDTFTAIYPNDDYVDAYNNGYENVYVTRPHNMYLQIGVQTGVVSLLAIVVFYGIYAVKSFRLYWKRNTKNLEECVGLGIFLGTSGYMLAGIINDSSVTVAPLFWCFLGIGMSINQRIQKITVKNQAD